MAITFTWVYLIYDPYTGYFKIGKSDNPHERIKQLCNPASYGTIPAAPTGYELLEAWLCPTSWESDMHNQYAKARVHGEWFDLQTLWDIPNSDTVSDVVLMVFGKLMANQQRLIAGGSRATERLESYEKYVVDLENQIEAFEAQIEQAKLQGYMPRLLYPAPAVDPDGPWPDVISRCDGAENAAAVDELREAGEIL